MENNYDVSGNLIVEDFLSHNEQSELMKGGSKSSVCGGSECLQKKLLMNFLEELFYLKWQCEKKCELPELKRQTSLVTNQLK